MYLKWFGILDKRVGKIFSYCWNTDIKETGIKLVLSWNNFVAIWTSKICYIPLDREFQALYFMSAKEI